MGMSEGFRIKKSWTRIAPDIAEQFRSIPVANVSDSMSRMDAGGCDLRPMHRDGMLVGPALTVRTRPGDNLMLHKAIDMAQIRRLHGLFIEMQKVGLQTRPEKSRLYDFDPAQLAQSLPS
jgi:hypothetical protein